MIFSYQRYLASKSSVDARSIHSRIWSYFTHYINNHKETDVYLLELGCGLGNMLPMIAKNCTDKTLYYTGIDSNKDNIYYARKQFFDDVPADPSRWQAVDDLADTHPSCLARFIHSDLFDMSADDLGRPVDAVVAKALIDIVPIRESLRKIVEWAKEGAALYCPITFNGQTVMFPTGDDPVRESQVWSIYHGSMEHSDKPGNERLGGSRAGDRLVRELLRMPGATSIDLGASDWFVKPDSYGNYQDDEQYFLQHIVHLIDDELKGSGQISAHSRMDWVATRNEQIQSGTLAMRAHNLDVLAHL